jgi:hypothetical protein
MTDRDPKPENVMSIQDLLIECSEPYTREEYDRDHARLLAVIAAKHGISEADVHSLVAEHRYVHSGEDEEDEYIQMLGMARHAGWA